MVAPIAGILAGFGLLAGRSLFQQRMKQQQDEAFRGALGSLFGVGVEPAPDLAQGQEGPPRPLAIGSNLTERQSGALQALQQTNPELALQMGMTFQQANANQAQAQQQQTMDQARLDVQRGNLQVARDRLGFDHLQMVQANNLRLQDLAKQQRVLTDPQFAVQDAIERGSSVYGITGPDGTMQLAAVPGSDAFVQMEQGMQETTRTLDNVSEIDRLMRQFWSEGSDPRSPIVRRIQGLAAQTRLDIKDSEFNLGALTGPDVQFLDAILSDPTTLTEQMTSNPEAIAQGIAGLQERIGGRAAQELSRTALWQGTNQALRDRATQAVARTRQSIERAAQELQAAELTAAGADQAPGQQRLIEAAGERAGSQGFGLLRQILSMSPLQSLLR